MASYGSPPPGYGGGGNAARSVQAPALALLIIAIVFLLFQILQFIFAPTLVSGFIQQIQAAQAKSGQPVTPVDLPQNLGRGPLDFLFLFLMLAGSAVVIYGALQMKNLKNYPLAMAASIIAMIPYVSPCCCVGLPIGIWALVVLLKPEVKSAFT
jgi:hypothetical protein